MSGVQEHMNVSPISVRIWVMYDKASRPDSYAKLFIYVVADQAAVTN